MIKKDHLIELGSENIGKLLRQYAIPAIIAMAAASLYNITDSIFIGHGVGKDAFNGLSITFPLMNLMAAFGSLVGVGGSALLSIKLGQNDLVSANNILGNVFIMSVIIGITYSLIVYLNLDLILIFFGATESMLPHARDFMKIILLGTVITHMYWGLNSLLRSSGHPNLSMMATIYIILINLILNPLFIFVFGWGIKGSAWATVISQAIILLWQIYLFNNKKEIIYFKKGIFHLKKRIVLQILSIGMSPFLMNAVSCIVIIMINKSLNYYGQIEGGTSMGDDAVGAYGIVNRIASLFIMIVFGLNQGMQPIAGYNFGAKLYDRVIEVLKKTLFYATLIMTFGFLMVEIFPHLIASFFIGKNQVENKQLIDMAARGLRIVFIFYPLVGFQIVSSTLFQSINKAKKAIFLSLTRQVIFLIPSLLILPPYLGIDGVWLSMPIADFVTIILSFVLLYNQIQKIKKMAKTT